MKVQSWSSRGLLRQFRGIVVRTSIVRVNSCGRHVIASRIRRKIKDNRARLLFHRAFDSESRVFELNRP